jgi:periplasmic divalent cation tolerance protein
LEAAIRQIHPYDTPEIIATPITLGSHDYLRWIDEET